MKEIGGYIELESFKNPPYHNKAISINSGRNALRYIIRTYNVKDILVPKYTCRVVYEALESEHCKAITYSIDENLIPKLDNRQYDLKTSYILYNNYFGVCGNAINDLAKQYSNLIIDNAQAFYSSKKGLAAFYSPRKFFGLPDGGLLLCDTHLKEEFEQDTSYDRCSHLLKRHDLSATDGFKDFQQNDDSLINRPIKYMSKLTQSLIGNINYNDVKKIRLENFSFLHAKLGARNEFKINLANDDIPLVYPFLVKNNDLRKKLIANKVYTATYWPELEKYCEKGSFELYLQQNLIAIPIDQRYDLTDMKFILGLL
jgi:hypothetical protein